MGDPRVHRHPFHLWGEKCPSRRNLAFPRDVILRPSSGCLQTPQVRSALVHWILSTPLDPALTSELYQLQNPDARDSIPHPWSFAGDDCIILTIIINNYQLGWRMPWPGTWSIFIIFAVQGRSVRKSVLEFTDGSMKDIAWVETMFFFYNFDSRFCGSELGFCFNCILMLFALHPLAVFIFPHSVFGLALKCILDLSLNSIRRASFILSCLNYLIYY